MQFNGKEYNIYELYSAFSTLKTDENVKKDELLEKEFIRNDINFSRISFKKFRDELVRCHLGYVEEKKNSADSINKDIYEIDRLSKKGKVDYGIGRVVDYDIPVKKCNCECECDIDINKIDLITETATNIYLVNTVNQESQESLLRVIMEIITYRNMISRTKLISEFNIAERNKLKYYHTKDDLVPAVMLYENTRAHDELKNIKINSLAGKLVDKYKMKFFVLKQREKGLYELVE